MSSCLHVLVISLSPVLCAASSKWPALFWLVPEVGLASLVCLTSRKSGHFILEKWGKKIDSITCLVTFNSALITLEMSCWDYYNWLGWSHPNLIDSLDSIFCIYTSIFFLFSFLHDESKETRPFGKQLWYYFLLFLII